MYIDDSLRWFVASTILVLLALQQKIKGCAELTSDLSSLSYYCTVQLYRTVVWWFGGRIMRRERLQELMFSSVMEQDNRTDCVRPPLRLRPKMPKIHRPSNAFVQSVVDIGKLGAIFHAGAGDVVQRFEFSCLLSRARVPFSRRAAKGPEELPYPTLAYHDRVSCRSLTSPVPFASCS